MNDTDDKTRLKQREILMQKSGAERVAIASSMYDTARAVVLASLSPDLTERERKVALFDRMYRGEFDAPTRAKIHARLK